jgi:branched-chain amino acid transport system substrate-binding protein
MANFHLPGRRRATRVAGLAATISVALICAACASGGGSQASGGGDTGGSGATIKIGYIAPFGTGFSGQNATDVETGIRAGIQYLNEHGGVLHGAKIQIVNGTETGEAAVVSSTVQTMLGEGIGIFIGPGLTADCQAAGQLFDNAGALTLTSCVTTSLTGASRPTKDLYRAGTNDSMQATAIGYVLGKQFKDLTQVDTFAYDTAQGHSTWTQIQAQLKKLNPSIKIGLQYFVPQTSTDYRSQLGAMANAEQPGGKKALALLSYGPGVLNFFQQGAPLGLLKDYSVIITTNEYYVEAEALKGTAPDMWNAYDVCDYQLFNNPLMSYLTSYLKTDGGGAVPDDWSVNGFDRMLIIGDAINKAGSADPAKVMAALNTIQANTAVGQITMNPTTHQADVPTAVCETVGDPSAPTKVKMISGTVVPASVTLPGN